MPTVTINIAGQGTLLANGETSSFGHMWYELNDGNGGQTESYGFAPDNNYYAWPFPDNFNFEGIPVAPGRVYDTDSDNYKSLDYSQTLEISQDQYEAMRNFANNPTEFGFNNFYDGLENSCVDFTWKALELGGLNPNEFQGDLLPSNNIDDVRKLVDISPLEIGRASCRERV